MTLSSREREKKITWLKAATILARLQGCAGILLRPMSNITHAPLHDTFHQSERTIPYGFKRDNNLKGGVGLPWILIGLNGASIFDRNVPQYHFS